MFAYLEENCVRLSLPKEISKLIGFCDAVQQVLASPKVYANLHGGLQRFLVYYQARLLGQSEHPFLLAASG